MADSFDASARPKGSLLRGWQAPLAVLLLACAVVFLVSYRIADRSENHSYNAGATPHFPVHVTLGKQYELSTPGGLDALNRRGIVAASVACSWSGGGVQSTLGISSLAGTRAVHAFATFVGPMTGEISIRCDDVPALFVDDADNAASDPAGLFVLLATVSLTAGVALAMSELYRRSTAKRNRATPAIDRETTLSRERPET